MKSEANNPVADQALRSTVSILRRIKHLVGQCQCRMLVAGIQLDVERVHGNERGNVFDILTPKLVRLKSLQPLRVVRGLKEST